jgi:hypothetical protein
MADSKKPPRHTPHTGSSLPGVRRPSGSAKAVDPAVRLAACEAGLARVTSDIAALRVSVEVIVAELDDLRAHMATSPSRRRKLPPPVLRDTSHEIITVDEREVTLESIRPKRPR